MSCTVNGLYVELQPIAVGGRGTLLLWEFPKVMVNFQDNAGNSV
jgi:hypothetical protein